MTLLCKGRMKGDIRRYKYGMLSVYYVVVLSGEVFLHALQRLALMYGRNADLRDMLVVIELFWISQCALL